MRTLCGILFAGVLAATAPASVEAQQPCNQECVLILNPAGQPVGMGCMYLPQGQIGGFNCHADVDGCDIERTGCGETEEDALLAAEDHSLLFGQGLIQTQTGFHHYALVPCALSGQPLFVVRADALAGIDLHNMNVDH